MRARREARRWSQTELAQRAGISRAAVSAIEGEQLSPSVTTALALAALFERSVEELSDRATSAKLFASDWAWQPRAEASRYWEAEVSHRPLLYPVEAVTLNQCPRDGSWRNGAPHGNSPAAQPTLVMASCDPAAGLLAAEYARATGFRLLVFPRGGRVASRHYTLSRQIEAGAPADIGFAADETKTDALEKRGLIVSGTRNSSLGNTLVIVTPSVAPTINSPAELTFANNFRVARKSLRTIGASALESPCFSAHRVPEKPRSSVA